MSGYSHRASFGHFLRAIVELVLCLQQLPPSLCAVSCWLYVGLRQGAALTDGFQLKALRSPCTAGSKKKGEKVSENSTESVRGHDEKVEFVSVPHRLP